MSGPVDLGIGKRWGHIDEQPCNVCGHCFDAHDDDCPVARVEELEAALEAERRMSHVFERQLYVYQNAWEARDRCIHGPIAGPSELHERHEAVGEADRAVVRMRKGESP